MPFPLSDDNFYLLSAANHGKLKMLQLMKYHSPYFVAYEHRGYSVFFRVPAMWNSHQRLIFSILHFLMLVKCILDLNVTFSLLVVQQWRAEQNLA